MGKLYDDLQKQAKGKTKPGFRSSAPKVIKPIKDVLTQGDVDRALLKAEAEITAEQLDRLTLGPVPLGKPFLLQVPAEMEKQLEAERVKRGLRSRAGTIRVLLEEALK